MAVNDRIYVSELSVSKHIFRNYHLCRGNSNRRKTRLGIVEKGRGTYIYLGKKLSVSEGDVVFIPENIFCYSEWHGDTEIKVSYISCFMHYDNFCYEPQTVSCTDEEKRSILQICDLISSAEDQADYFRAYAMFYGVLETVFPRLVTGNIALNKTLRTAIEYITRNWKEPFSVNDLAKACCVSESTVYHLFKTELGQTPVQFNNSIKINVAIEYLENTNYSISTVSRLANFNSENHFRKVFSDFTGMTPMKFRRSK